MDLNPFRDLSSREGDGLVLAFELVLSTSIFAGLGFLIDRALGTLPLFTLLLGVFTLGYTVWRMVNGYDTEMAEHAGRREPLRRGPIR